MVYSHIDAGCKATPKVHLMWRHVLEQMMEVGGGLGQKREDWVEHLHQLTLKKRTQFRTVISQQQRGDAMAGNQQQESDPAVVKHLGDVDHDALRGPRKSHVRIAEQRNVLRRESRLTALQEWESSSRGTAVNKAVSKVQARMKGIVVRKQMRPLLRGPAAGAANDGPGGGHKRTRTASPASTDVTSGADSMVFEANMHGPHMPGHRRLLPVP